MNTKLGQKKAVRTLFPVCIMNFEISLLKRHEKKTHTTMNIKMLPTTCAATIAARIVRAHCARTHISQINGQMQIYATFSCVYFDALQTIKIFIAFYC